jgi:hypothetical protein
VAGRQRAVGFRAAVCTVSTGDIIRLSQAVDVFHAPATIARQWELVVSLVIVQPRHIDIAWSRLYR